MPLSLGDESLAIRGLLPLWRRGLRQLRKPRRPRSSPTTAKRSSPASLKRSRSFGLDQIWSARSTRDLRCGGRRWFPNSSPSRPWSLLGGLRSRLRGGVLAPEAPPFGPRPSSCLRVRIVPACVIMLAHGLVEILAADIMDIHIY